MQTFSAVLSVMVVICYASFSGLWVDSSSNWYRSLNRPKWQPPDFVFGIIWPYNFFVLALASVQVCLNGSAINTLVWLINLLVSVIFAIGWSADFYKNRNLRRSALWLGLNALSTTGLMLQIWITYPAMFFWVLPYQIWLTVASSLAVGYAQLNPK